MPRHAAELGSEQNRQDVAKILAAGLLRFHPRDELAEVFPVSEKPTANGSPLVDGEGRRVHPRTLRGTAPARTGGPGGLDD